MFSRLYTINTISWLLISIALVITSVFLLIAVNQTGNRVTTEEVKSIEESINEIDYAVKQEGKVSAVSSQLQESNKNLIAAISALKTSSNQNAFAELDKATIQLAIIQIQLDADRDSLAQNVSKLRTQLDILRTKTSPTITADKIIQMVLTALGSTIGAIIWPLFLLILIIWFICSQKALFRLKEFLSGFKSVKVFSAEFVLSEETKFRAEDTLDTYRRQVKEQYDLWVQRKSLNQIFRNSYNEIVKHIDNYWATRDDTKNLTNYRCTIHVPDLLFAETFYQLLDYSPHRSGANTRGRTWSVRFGIIGKVWRSRHDEITGNVKTGDPVALVKEWGMTLEEAEQAGKGKKSFICVLLKHEGVNVGMFYMDAEASNAFLREHAHPASKKSLVDCITESCKNSGLTKALFEINEDLGGKAPLIRVYNEY